MHDLLKTSIETHGGLARWNDVRRISACFTPGGLGLTRRGQETFANTPTRVTVELGEQKASFEPFLAAGQRGVFTPGRTAVETLDGIVLEELISPRASFGNDVPHWSASQLAYFAGCAMWTYLTLPFSLAQDGIECVETTSWTEDDGRRWRTLRVTFPASYVTHSSEQTLYFDEVGLIHRHDYTVDISNGARAAHYLYDHRRFDGIMFPTRRRIHQRNTDDTPQSEVVVFSADLDDFRLS